MRDTSIEQLLTNGQTGYRLPQNQGLPAQGLTESAQLFGQKLALLLVR